VIGAEATHVTPMLGMVRELESRNAVYPVKDGKKLKPVIPKEKTS
jgi:hypothetical protein